MPAINNLPALYESMKGNGNKKYKSSINNDSSSLPLRTKIQTKIQVRRRMMWHLKHKADICIRSEILHGIHNVSPVEIVQLKI